MNQSPTPEQFDAAFKTWLEGAQKKVDDHWTEQKYTHAMSPVLKFKQGSRYMIVQACDRDLQGNVQQRGRAYAFIDRTGGDINGTPHKVGDVLKPASWKVPAKHARGNIFDAKNGLGSLSAYGPEYLR